MARIVGSDIAHAAPLTLVGGIGHSACRFDECGDMGLLLIGSLPGIFWQLRRSAGSDKAVRYTFAAVLFVVGGKLVF